MFHETFSAITDTLLNEENIKKLTLLGAEHDFQKEKDNLAAQIKQQRIIQYGTAAGLFDNPHFDRYPDPILPVEQNQRKRTL